MSTEFKAYYKTYLDWQEKTQAKSPLTLRRESSSLKKLAKFFNITEIDAITSKDLNEYALVRRKQGVTNRSVNLDITALSNVLKFAQLNEIIPSTEALVTSRWTPLKYVAPRRSLITVDTLQALVTEARARVPLSAGPDNGNLLPVTDKPKYENGELFADLILFMAYSGARREAALSARWEQVDWANRQITLFTKFDKKVVVDFNEKLEDQLKQMRARRDAQYAIAVGSYLEDLQIWIFPSPARLHRGRLVNPQWMVDTISTGAGIEGFRLHDLRHFFISHCIMAGVDTMTVASWVGHADGGVLIGKVYGHLNPQHKRDAAAKVKF